MHHTNVVVIKTILTTWLDIECKCSIVYIYLSTLGTMKKYRNNSTLILLVLYYLVLYYKSLDIYILSN